MDDALLNHNSLKAQHDKLFREIYEAASNAAGSDAATDMEKYFLEHLSESFIEELHTRLINHHLEIHIGRLIKLFNWNCEKWMKRHYASHLQLYTDGLFLTMSEVYHLIYGEICKASTPIDSEGVCPPSP